MAMDYEKTPSDKNVTVWIGPSGGTTLGITDIAEPLAVELNNTGGTSGMIPASQSISWNDFDFGTQASEVLNEPSLADSASYEEFGQKNYGGGISFYLPQSYDDNSNLHSVIYDLTDQPGEKNDLAIRIDGARPTTATAADGDLVSAYRAQGEGETNPFTPGESKRRTVNFIPKSSFSHLTVVGDHAITAAPRAVTPWKTLTKGRIRALQQGRDTTNRLIYTTTNSAVVEVYPGGFYDVKGAAATTATINITDPDTGDTIAVTVTVTA